MESSGIFKRERNYRDNSITLNLSTMIRIFPGSEDMVPLEHFVTTVFMFNMFFEELRHHQFDLPFGLNF